MISCKNSIKKKKKKKKNSIIPIQTEGHGFELEKKGGLEILSRFGLVHFIRNIEKIIKVTVLEKLILGLHVTSSYSKFKEPPKLIYSNH